MRVSIARGIPGGADVARIKTVAKELLRTLKAEKLRVDQWRE